MDDPGTKCLSLWTADGSAEPHRSEMGPGVRLHPDAAPSLGWSCADATAVTLQTVVPLDDVVAVAYVGEAMNSPVALNGIPLDAGGMYTLRQADRIDVGTSSYWLSGDLSPLRVAYDPAQHGSDARCCMTKARLEQGQDIVICPGCAGVPCNVVYKAAAWDAVLQSNRAIKCHSCGYQPGQPQWRPPSPRQKRKPLNELSHFAPK